MQRETHLSKLPALPYAISILSLYAEGDCFLIVNTYVDVYFNPLPLCRGRPYIFSQKACYYRISILSLYAEGDGAMFAMGKKVALFQSSPSMQRETPTVFSDMQTEKISILSLYAEGDYSSKNIYFTF